jgi:catechol 2,3-dioxygenase-like lactoylglutathione lyase family enzyme
MIKLNHLGLRVSNRERASDWYVSTLGHAVLLWDERSMEAHEAPTNG